MISLHCNEYFVLAVNFHRQCFIHGVGDRCHYEGKSCGAAGSVIDWVSAQTCAENQDFTEKTVDGEKI